MLDASLVAENWHIWLVTAFVIVAATIDGWKLKVPNVLTYPFIVAGWGYSFWTAGWEGLGWSLLGTLVGLGVLFAVYLIGGMGAGDAKMLAGIGAWVWVEAVWNVFLLTVVIGGVIAAIMILVSGRWKEHVAKAQLILTELTTERNTEVIFQNAAARKSEMTLLPYGIPIAIGAIAYFYWAGLLF